MRQTGGQLVLEMTYPSATTGGLPLAGISALEVLALPPQPGGGVPNVDPRTFEATAVVARRLEGAELIAATRGAELVVTLDASAGSRFGPGTGAAMSAPATPTAAARATTTTDAGARGAAPPSESTPTAAPTRSASAGTTPTAAVDDAAGAVGAPPAQPGAASATRGPTPTPAPPTILLAVRTFGPRRHASPLSAPLAIAPRMPPPPPATLTVEGTGSGIALSWSAVPQAVAGFDVLRRGAGESTFGDPIVQLGSDRLTHTDPTAAYGMRYEYTVRSVAARQPLIESVDGPVRSIEHVDTFAPPTPTNVVALAEEGRVRLLWDRVEAVDLAGYRVWRQDGDGAPTELPREPGGGNEHVDDQVRSGTTYVYRVTAVDREDNESVPSEPATATPR